MAARTKSAPHKFPIFGVSIREFRLRTAMPITDSKMANLLFHPKSSFKIQKDKSPKIAGKELVMMPAEVAEVRLNPAKKSRLKEKPAVKDCRNKLP